MSVSSELINDFVKATNDTTSTRSEHTVYGVIVQNDNSTYVKLDGSEQLTPVSTVSTTKDGDRVMVLIKNHTATITGNFSSPSARSGDISGMEQNVSNKLNEVDEKLATMVTESSIANLTSKVEKVGTDLDSLKKNVETNANNIKTINESYDTLKKTVDDTSKTVIDLSTYKETVEGTLADLSENKVSKEELNTMFGDRVIWSGCLTMSDADAITLEKKISEQITGVCFIFSEQSNGEPVNQSIASFLVSKRLVLAQTGYTHCFMMSNGLFTTLGVKTLRIYDDKITGVADNIQNGTNNGITFDNSKYALRYIVGV